MASKIYTAQEMREMADELDDAIYTTAAAMLRQAADALEREETREKNYQYAVKWNGVAISYISSTAEEARNAVKELNADGLTIARLVRREVGEWEDVKDEN